MKKKIRNYNDLSNVLDQYIKRTLEETQNIVEEAIQESIDEYYKEKVFRNKTSNIPTLYERTNRLMNSLVKTAIVKSNGVISCQVKIDESYLNYHYPNYLGLSATGRDVLNWNNVYGSHGGTVDGDWRMWDEAIDCIGGQDGILYIFKEKLKNKGLTIK